MHVKKGVLFFLIIMVILRVHGQEIIPNPILDNYYAYFSDEEDRVQLHLNKKIYAPNELAFFTAYLFSSKEANRTQSQTYNLNVGIYNITGKLIETEVFQIVNGVAIGSLSMDKPTGVYYIRAQLGGTTATSRPFVDKITITSEVLIDLVEIEETAYTLDTSCEGGMCIEGINNELVFRLLGLKNQDVSIVNAIVKDENEKTITTLNYTKKGLGYGTFIPESGIVYNLVVTLSSGLTISKTITKVSASDVKVSANVMLEKDLLVSFEIPKDITITPQEYTIVFHNAGNLKLNTVSIKEESKVIKFPFDELLPDVSILTVLNAKRQSIFERLIYNPKHSVKARLPAEVSVLKTTSSDSMKVQVSFDKVKGHNVRCLSASVVPDESLVWQDALMDKELIFGPYFTRDKLKATPNLPLKDRRQRKDLDVYLMLYGKSNYDLQEILGTTQESQRTIATGFHISGNIKMPSTWRNATLVFYQKSINELYTTTIANDGSFEFKNCFVHKGEKLILSATVDGKPLAKPEITLELLPQPLQDSLSKTILAHFAKTQNQAREELIYTQDLENITSKDVVSLDKILLKGKKKEEDNLVRNDKLTGGAWSAKKINADDIRRSPMLSQFIRRLGFRVSTDAVSGKLVILARNPLNPSPVVYIDGFLNGSLVTNTQLDNIDEIYYEQYGVDASIGGTIYIYKKYGNNLGEEKVGIVQKSPTNGYSIPQDYENQTLYASFNKKQRSYAEVHWEYNVISDRLGKATLHFPHFGVKDFKILLQGIDNEGKVISEIMTFSKS